MKSKEKLRNSFQNVDVYQTYLIVLTDRADKCLTGPINNKNLQTLEKC